jgi:hypothetical protein
VAHAFHQLTQVRARLSDQRVTGVPKVVEVDIAADFAGLVAYDLLKIEAARDLAASQERLHATDDCRRAEEERAAQREADRRAQASKVTAWFDFFEVLRGNALHNDDGCRLGEPPSVTPLSCRF